MLKYILCYFFLFEICSSIFINTNSRYIDYEKCSQEKNETLCKIINFEAKDLQCCIQKNQIDSDESSEGVDCNPLIKPITEAKQYMKTEKGKAIFAENSLYSIFSEEETPQNFRQTVTYDCNDGEVSMVADSKILTNEDKTLIKSDEHCLKYGIYQYNENEINEEKCLSLKLIKKSTDLGLTCGYYELNLKLNDGTNSTFKYCGPFDKEIYYTKKLNWMDKRDFDEAIYMETRKVDKDIEEYTAYFAGEKNRTMIYYSTNDTVIYIGPDDIPPTDRNAANALFYGYLFFLVFLII